MPHPGHFYGLLNEPDPDPPWPPTRLPPSLIAAADEWSRTQAPVDPLVQQQYMRQQAALGGDPDHASIGATPSRASRIGQYLQHKLPRQARDAVQGGFYGTGAGALRIGQALWPGEQPRMAAMEQFGLDQIPEEGIGAATGLLGSFAPEFTLAGDLADLGRIPGHLGRGEWGGAGLSALAAVPIVGTPAAGLLKARRGVRAATEAAGIAQEAARVAQEERRIATVADRYYPERPMIGPEIVRDPELLPERAASLEAARRAQIVELPAQRVRAEDVGKVGVRRPDGSYVGAPQFRGTTRLDTPGELAKMQQTYVERVARGVDGRNWYDDSSRWIEGAVPPGMENWFTRTLAITSARTPVKQNLGYALQAASQRGVGAPIQTGGFPTSMSRLITDVAQAVGPKRGPFWSNLRTPEEATTAVHDIWQGRAFGYENISNKVYDTEEAAIKAITDQRGNVSGRVFASGDGFKTAKPWDKGFGNEQHAFMDEQMDEVVAYLNKNKVGGHSDWDHANAQAAAWTGMQLESGRILPEQAAQHYGSFSPYFSASATYERVPRGMDPRVPGDPAHLPGVRAGSYEEQLQFGAEAPHTTPEGLDRYYSALGQVQDPTSRMSGIFRNPFTGKIEYAPGDRAGMLTQSLGGQVVPEAREILNTVEGGRAYLDVQNAGAWHHVIPSHQTKPLQRTSITIALDASPTDDQLEALQVIAEREGMFVVDTGRGVNLIEDVYGRPPGINDLMERILKDGKGSLTKAELDQLKGWSLYGETLGPSLTRGSLGDEIGDILPGAVVDRAFIDSGYLDYADLWKEFGSRKATTKFLDDVLQNPALARALEPELRAQARATLSRNERLRDAGDVVREDVMNALRILSEEGLARLRKAVNEGAVLPSVAILGALGLRHLAPVDATDEGLPDGLLR
jgi:hypothetical protein